MLELTIYLSSNQTTIFSDYLSELGALAITLCDAQDNPIFEPALDTNPLWPEIKLLALFSGEPSLEEILLRLYTHPEASHIIRLEKKIIADQDWVKQTQALTQPQCFGDNLWIYPSWHEKPTEKGITLLLDPGIAFGTGSHPTTRLMLTWLAQNPPSDLSVIDYGCGSGILAIAAAKLGAKKVWATDIDPQALQATRDNAAINHLNETTLSTYLPENLPQNIKADLILANILAEPLVQLVDTFINYLNPQGLIVLSGILETQIDMVKAAYADKFSLVTITKDNEWVSIVQRSL